MKKQYILNAFPFPSGKSLHVGHSVGYLATDIYHRYLQFKGIESFNPYGFDSFGLPVEMAAIQNNMSCEDVVEQNISKFKEQLNLLDLDIDWNNEIRTSDESYYKFTQWIFLLLYNSWFNALTNKAEDISTCPHNNIDDYRLAYKKYSEVNWCEDLQTVLANEEIEDGKSIRGGFPITKKEYNQWFLRITAYVERLLEGLNDIEWKNKSNQIKWIGKSVGYVIYFDVYKDDIKVDNIKVFTSKPYTLNKVNYIACSLNSKFSNGIEGNTEYKVKIPIYNNIVPMYSAEYVIDDYGTGYVMGVIDDDKRDTEYAKKYNILKDMPNEYLPNLKELLIQNGVGYEKICYKLHDITFSRQRKYGEPIPIEGETDTMPSYAGSNWYFFRYFDNKNSEYFSDKEKQKQYLPVDLYVIGSEHNTGHLLYSRFITKVLYDRGHSIVDEPYKKIINVGLMNASDGTKMSKSKGNIVNPDEVISKYGVDAYRLWICFIAPFEQTKIWKEDGLKGCVKFLNKFENLMLNKISEDENLEQVEMYNKLYNQVCKDIENFSFNTAIPRFMTFVNEISKHNKCNITVMYKVLELLGLFCPSFKNKF